MLRRSRNPASIAWLTSVFPVRRLSGLAIAAPLLVLAMASFWCGTFQGGAGAAARTAMAASVLLLALVGARAWRDPVGVGGVLPLALLVLVVASFVTSPVRRAGLEAVVLLPAFGLATAATARCWRGLTARRWAARGVAMIVFVGSAWALADWGLRGAAGALVESARPGLPLGHHNLLACWLVSLLPLASLTMRQAGLWRVVGVLAVAFGGAALLLSGSLAGVLAAAVQLLVWLAGRRAKLRLAAVLIGGLLGLSILSLYAVRLGDVARFEDPSLRVRLAYATGVLQGVMRRPGLGWGPGASRWTLGEFVDAAPGLRPPGEVVSDPHSVALLLTYELGASGLVLAVGLVTVFIRRRLGELVSAPEVRKHRSAALLGLLGFGLTSLMGRPFSCAALPLVAAVLAGAALGGSNDPRRASPWPVWLYCLVAVGLLVRPSLAALEYERAAATPAEATLHVERAVRLDPGFPLYRVHRALSLATAEPGSAPAAREAALAARQAEGLAPLWLLAGLLAADAAQGSGSEALLRACELDPLGALAPFQLMRDDPRGGRAAEYGARAIVADPVLATAVDWNGSPRTFADAVALIETWPGVPEGWRGELLEALRRLERRRQRRRTASGERLQWTLEVDGSPSTAVALHAFRRLPWTFELGNIELDAVTARWLDVPPAGTLRATAATAFPRHGCGAPAAMSAER